MNVNQIDLAPTLSCLLGLPFPATSLGRPAVELFDEPAPARLTRLRAGLSEVEAAWAKPTGAGAGARAPLGADPSRLRRRRDQKRALDARFAAILTAFTRNVARTRVPVALWGLVLLVFLIAQMGELALPGARSAAAVALLASGPRSHRRFERLDVAWARPLLGRRLLPCGLAEWRRSRFASPVHRLWLLSAGAAVLLALAREHQGRRTTLLFGSPTDAPAGGRRGGLLSRAARARTTGAGRHWRALFLSGLMLPIVFLAVMEGGDPAIAIGNGFFVAWLPWDAAAVGLGATRGQALRTLGVLAPGALLDALPRPARHLGWIRGAAVSTAIGAVAALAPCGSCGRALSLRAAFARGPRSCPRSPWGSSFWDEARSVRPPWRWDWRCCSPASSVSRCALGGVRTHRRASGAWRVCWSPCGGFSRHPRKDSSSVSAPWVWSRSSARSVGRPDRRSLRRWSGWRWPTGAGGWSGTSKVNSDSARSRSPWPTSAIRDVTSPRAPSRSCSRPGCRSPSPPLSSPTRRKAARARAILQATAFAVGARIVHLALATAFNPDSFYTMHRILGELTHQFVLLIGIGLFSLALAPRLLGEPQRRSIFAAPAS